MSAIQKIMDEFTDKLFDVYPDDEGIWGKPVITITFGDFRKAAREYAAMQARIDALENKIKRLDRIPRRKLKNGETIYNIVAALQIELEKAIQ